MKKRLWLTIVLGVLLVAGFASEAGTCRRPAPWHAAQCRAQEDAILASTVRLAIHGWIEIEDGYDVIRIQGTLSHGSVIDDRTLLTHNHFGLPLSRLLVFNRHAAGGFTGVSMYRADGTPLLDQAPLDCFVVVEELGETLLLDFGTIADQGFFAALDVPSVPLVHGAAARLRPGVEVAQIDWDRRGQSRVNWTMVQSVYRDDGLPLARVDHLIAMGASGGGLFLNGEHVGNNWGRVTETNLATGVVREVDSLVALNP